MQNKTSEAEVAVVAGTADLILGVATGISPVGTAVSLFKVFEERKARKLEKIILAFFTEIQETDEVREFLNKCDADEKEKELFSDKLLDLLGDLDDESKSKIIGKLFTCHREGKIGREEFFILSDVINRVRLNTLYALKSWRNQPESIGSLLGLGLLKITFERGPQSRLTDETPPRDIDYEPTGDGYKLLRLGVLKEWV